jgi:broad specificity phosphatase PhoE
VRIFLVFCFILTQQALFGEEKLPTVFYLVRHGQTDWNLAAKLQGHADIPLNDTGRGQARQLSEKLDGIAFNVCFSSDLERAVETAQILSGARCLSLGVDARLRERHFGSWEGRLTSELSVFLEKEGHPATIETAESIQDRVLFFLKETAELYPGSTILVVTHGGVITALLAKLLPCECRTLFDIQIRNMGHVQIQAFNGKYEIQEMQGVQIP